MPHKAGNGAIFGIVSEDGIAKPDFPVTLYDRSNGKLVNRQKTDENGGFTFNGLNRTTDDYQVVAQDEDNPPYKNAIIRDRITPVPGYRGKTLYQNWLWKSMQLGSELRFTARVNEDGSSFAPEYPTRNYPVVQDDGREFSNSTYSYRNPPTVGPSITPGAPYIPSTILNNEAMNIPAIAQAAYSSTREGIRHNPCTIAIECVVDTNSVSSNGTPGNGYIYISAASEYYIRSYMDFEYPIAGLYIYKDHITYRQSTNGSSLYFGPGTRELGSVDIDPGVHHIVVTMTFAFRARLYIDGVMVDEQSLAGMNASYYNYSNASYRYFGGIVVGSNQHTTSNYAYNPNGAWATLGLIAVYPFDMEDDDVQSLYNAAMVGGEPETTGFNLEVLSKVPLFWLPMTEQAADNTVRAITSPLRGHELVTYGTITPGIQSPVVGQTMWSLKDAAIVVPAEGGRTLRIHGYTFMFLARPNAPIEAITHIVMQSNYQSSETSTLGRYGAQVYLDATGHFVVVHDASGAETITFDTVMDDTENVHLFMVVVDKVAYEARLYSDGELIETKETNQTEFTTTDYYEQDYMVNTAMVIGGQAARGQYVNYGFDGDLGHVAMFARALRSDEIKEIADAIKVP